MASVSCPIAATVHLLGLALTKDDQQEIAKGLEPDLRLRWSVPSTSILAELTEQSEGFRSAVLVHLSGLGIEAVAEPRSGGADREGEGNVWRGVEKLVSGISGRQLAADGRVTCDSYVVFDLANDLVAIEIPPPDRSSSGEERPMPIDAALDARFGSLSRQWRTILGEIFDQTRGPVARVYVLSEQDDRWVLALPDESRGFLGALKPGGLLANPHESGADPPSARTGSSS